jgi:predicted nucleotidyltransferase
MIKHTPILHKVSELIPKAAAYLKKRKDVLFACHFGSMGSGICKPLSDIDIAVYLKKGNLSEKSCRLSAILLNIQARNRFKRKFGRFFFMQEHNLFQIFIRFLKKFMNILLKKNGKRQKHTAYETNL